MNLDRNGFSKVIAILASAAFVFSYATAAARAEVDTVRIANQPSLVYMPMIVADRAGLIKKKADEMGLPELNVQFLTMSGGGASVEALLSGNVDLVMSGVTNMLLMNDRMRGRVKGFFAIGGTPIKLLTRNPQVKGVGDFTESDRIALPTVKTSVHAVVLQMAAEQAFGSPEALDNITVQLGHTDAMAMLSNTSGEVNSHFSAPPFQQREMAISGVHEVMNSYDVVGQELTNAILFGLSDFADENPTVVEALMAAVDEANTMIKDNPLEAAKLWIEATNETLTPEEVVAIMTEPGTVFTLSPKGQMIIAKHFFETGIISTEYGNWKEFYIDGASNLDGN